MGSRPSALPVVGSLAIVLALASLAPLRAQNEVVPQRDFAQLGPYTEREVSEWLPLEDQASDPRFRAQVMARYAEPLDEGRYGFVLQGLADEFRATTWPSHAEVKARFQREMDSVANAFVAAMAEHVPQGAVSTNEQRSRILREMRTTSGRGAESLKPQKRFVAGTEEDEELVFFPRAPGGGAEDAEIVTYRRVEGGVELLVPREPMVDLRLRADAVGAVFQHFVDAIQDAQARAIREADQGWQNYLFRGYSQYPWEALLNGAVLEYDAFHPPTEQWILLHPTVGFAASTVSLDEIRADEVFNVEVLGYLRYYGKRSERYLGGSLSATLRDDLGPGIGLTAHWTRSFSLGITWHDDDEDDEWFDDDPYLFLSFDLFRHFQEVGPDFAEKYDQIRELVGTL